MHITRVSAVCFALLLTACQVGEIEDSQELGTTQESILGGTPGVIGEFPTAVALSVGGGLCTGTLIAPDWVLTAAHCITPSLLGLGSQQQVTAQLQIIFDAQSLFDGSGRAVAATETIPHPGFGVSSLGDNDIGLIRLASPVTDRAPTLINRFRDDAPVGITLTQVGYGATQVGGGGAGSLQVLRNKATTNCSNFGVSDANILCFSQSDGTGKCQGDSGGPSYATIDGLVRVVGVTSFGDQNCAQFGADTRVDAELEFLFEHAPELQCQADGQCNDDCGKGALPIDEDCDICTTNTECEDDQVCNGAGQCIAAPFTPGGDGSTCANNNECESSICATSEDEGICTSTCTSNDSCLDGFECIEASGTNICWPEENDDGSCSVGGGSGAPVGGTLVFFAMLLGFRRRRV